jgi:hypothetical protein
MEKKMEKNGKKEKLIKMYKDNEDFLQYLMEYITEIEALGAEFEEFNCVINDGYEHHIYYFKLKDNFKLDKNIIYRDDENSQPDNTYTIFMGDLFIFETRYH